MPSLVYTTLQAVIGIHSSPLCLHLIAPAACAWGRLQSPMCPCKNGRHLALTGFLHIPEPLCYIPINAPFEEIMQGRISRADERGTGWKPLVPLVLPPYAMKNEPRTGDSLARMEDDLKRKHRSGSSFPRAGKRNHPLKILMNGVIDPTRQRYTHAHAHTQTHSDKPCGGGFGCGKEKHFPLEPLASRCRYRCRCRKYTRHAVQRSYDTPFRFSTCFKASASQNGRSIAKTT